MRTAWSFLAGRRVGRRTKSCYPATMSSPRACGPHTTLADNEGARVTRCACGAVHMLVKASGVTLQMPEERFQ